MSKEIEIVERLARVETKLDMAIDHASRINSLEKDMSLIKKVVSFIGSAFVIIGGWFVSNKH